VGWCTCTKVSKTLATPSAAILLIVNRYQYHGDLQAGWWPGFLFPEMARYFSLLHNIQACSIRILLLSDYQQIFGRGTAARA
jgi:hypothetical protein